MSHESYALRSSAEALGRAVMAELERDDASLLHKAIEVSCKAELLANGIKRCTVQIECKAGCGYLVQDFGEEADMLQEKAAAIKSLLREGVQHYSPKSLFEALQSLFPGIESRPNLNTKICRTF